MKQLPVEVGKAYDLVIEDLSHDGLGLARVDGFLIFVKDALPGERARARIISVKKKYAYAEVLIHELTSENRVKPACDLFDQCGGCQIQHLDYEGQLAFKKSIVVRNLQKFAGIVNPPVLDVIGMDNPWRYRNKTQVPFGRNDVGDVVAGFYKNRSHEIVDMPNCLVQSEIADAIVDKVRQLVVKFDIEPYDEKAGHGSLRHVVIRKGFKTGEVMVIFVTRTQAFPYQNEVVSALIQDFPSVKSMAHNVNPKVTNVIFGEETKIIYGASHITDGLDGLRFLISPRSFYQVNPVQTEVLYQKALAYAEVGKDDVIFDAYCGIGTITLFLARKAKKVYGVEIVPDAILDARRNAELNNLDNVTFEVGKSEVVIPKWVKAGVRPDVIVVDPPRKGCDSTLLATMIQAKPTKIVYVSCDSATLARDVKILSEGGYQLEMVQPVDLFPMTSHIENVACLIKVE